MKEEKNIKPKKSTFKFLIIFILAILIVFCVAKYITDDDFRYKIDTNLLKKQVSE